MSDTPATEKKLTVNDPVPPELLRRIGELTGARYDLADRLLDLEQQKVSILVSAKQIDDEKTRVFNKILMDRGLPPNTPIEIDGESGLIKVHQLPTPPAPAASEPAKA